MKQKWRNDKGFKSIQKLNRVLRNYLAINADYVFANIQGTLTNVYGPTRQMMEYTLVRLQSLAKIFDRVYNVCLEAGTYFIQKLQVGHLWSAALVILSVVSRVWVLSQYIVKSACRWYNEMFQFLDVLQPSLVPWLPKGYHLPDNLYVWLGSPSYVTEKDQQSDDEEDIGIPVTSKMPFLEHYRMPKQKKKNGGVPVIKIDESSSVPMDVDDSEGSLSEDHVRKLIEISTKEKTSPLQSEGNIMVHSLTNIRSFSDLKQFIKTEKNFHKLKRSKKKINNLENRNKKFYTQVFDKLQMRMFNKEMKTYLKKLKMVKENKEKEAALVKQTKKRLKLWFK